MENAVESKETFWNPEKIAKYEAAMSVIVAQIEEFDKAYYESTNSHFVRFIEKRLKTEDSITQKLVRKSKKREGKPLEDLISDLAGVRVICFDIDQIYMLAEKIGEVEYFHILKVKDYVRKPKENGYQSYHIVIGIEGVKVELQIRTILMDAWSSLESILVYKKSTPVSDRMKRDIQKIAGWSRKIDKMVAGMIEQHMAGNKGENANE